MSQLSLADQKADKSRVTAYPSITFPKFPFGAESRRRFEEARKQATRALEDAAIRRAKEGTAKPVLHKGKQVYVDGEPLYEHQYSDALLMFLLRAYDREKFGDRQVIELKLEDWDGDLSKLSEQSARRLLAQIEEKIAIEEAKENALALPAGQVIDGESERVPE